jgi:hypothetical protein
MIVQVQRLGRPPEAITPTSFADLTPANLVEVRVASRTAVALVFDQDLDAATVVAIRARCEASTDAEATIRARAQQALQGCRDYLANPSPTQADALAQVELLTRTTIGLIRLALRELDGDS